MATISTRRRPLILGSLLLPAAMLPGGLAGRQATPPAPGSGVPAVPFGINDSGQIVGYRETVSGDRRAVAWSAGQMVDLGAWPAGGSTAMDINDAGQIAGVAGDFETRAVTWRDGQIVDLGVLPGWLTSTAAAINEAGQIVGRSLLYALTPEGQATLWEDGRIVGLANLPGQDAGAALGINDRGQIVGVSGDHGVLWEGDEVIPLDPLPGDTWSAALAISNTGLIVGVSAASDPDEAHAVMWRDGQLIPLEPLPGDVESTATAINEAGQIVGYSGSAKPRNLTARAVLWEDGVAIELPQLPDSDRSEAAAINAAGQIVGISGEGRPVLWQDGQVLQLGTSPIDTAPPASSPEATPVPQDTERTSRSVRSSNAIGIGQRATIVGSASIDEDTGFAVLWNDGKIEILELLPGDTRGGGLDVNDDGQAVGVSLAADDEWHAVLWADGEVVALPMRPGDRESRAAAINGKGQIVGAAGSAEFESSAAVMWENDRIVTLPPLLGHDNAAAWKINEAGQIVGGSWVSEITRAVLWEGGEPVALGEPPDHTWSLARSINEAGQVVGWAGGADDTVRPVLWADGDVQVLPGDFREGQAFDINAAGEVVGFIVTTGGSLRAALWRDGALTDLGTLPGHGESAALAINDDGRIVGRSLPVDDAEGGRAVMWERGEIVALDDPVVPVAPGTPVVTVAPGEPAATAVPGERVEIAALDQLVFEPAEVIVSPGQEIIVSNIGALEHNLVVDEWSIATDLMDGGERDTVTVPADAEPGSTAIFYCSVPGHREAGMEGIFVVVEVAAPR